MGYVILFVFIIIVIFAAVIMHADSSFKAHQEELKNLQESIPNFTVTKTIADLENKFILLIDDKSKKVCIVNGKDKTIVDYDKIMSVEYIENGNTISSKSAMRTIGGAIVGGVLAGGAGAIVGGLSGNVKSVNKISSIVVKINLRDLNTPSIEILAFDCKWTVERKPVKPDDLLCTVHSEPAKQLVSALSVIIDEVDRGRASNNTKVREESLIEQREKTSVADEIKKLANLRDEGILTQDEFEKQKASLLS